MDFIRKVSSKSTDASTIYRKQGNEHYETGEWWKAIEQYTLAMIDAPPESQEFCLAISNRSAAAAKLEECVSFLFISILFAHLDGPHALPTANAP